jgi:hypothetical protein
MELLKVGHQREKAEAHSRPDRFPALIWLILCFTSGNTARQMAASGDGSNQMAGDLPSIDRA